MKVPVIAAGGIGDGRGIAAALALGAAGAQIGTAFLLTPEAKTVALHRAALKAAQRRQHDPHQSFHRTAGARHRQSLHPRGRARSAPMRRRFRWRPAPLSRCAPRPRPRAPPISCRCGADKRRRWRARCRRRELIAALGQRDRSRSEARWALGRIEWRVMLFRTASVPLAQNHERAGRSRSLSMRRTRLKWRAPRDDGDGFHFPASFPGRLSVRPAPRRPA